MFFSYVFVKYILLLKMLAELHFYLKLDAMWIFRLKKLARHLIWMKVQLGPNFEDQNVTNKELGIKVRIQVNSRGVKGHLSKCAISAFI